MIASWHLKKNFSDESEIRDYVYVCDSIISSKALKKPGRTRWTPIWNYVNVAGISRYLYYSGEKIKYVIKTSEKVYEFYMPVSTLLKAVDNYIKSNNNKIYAQYTAYCNLINFKLPFKTLNKEYPLVKMN